MNPRPYLCMCHLVRQLPIHFIVNLYFPDLSLKMVRSVRKLSRPSIGATASTSTDTGGLFVSLTLKIDMLLLLGILVMTLGTTKRKRKPLKPSRRRRRVGTNLQLTRRKVQ